MSASRGARLTVEGLSVRYGNARALTGVDLDLPPGSALAVLGANGAGKSTLARALTGIVRPSAGRVWLDDRDVTGRAPHRIARLGVAHVPEGRGVFPGLTVLENLRMGLRRALPRAERAAAMARAFERFPVLAERRQQRAGTLSGGQQQMLALARVLAAPPRLLVADELSLGLAPLLIDDVFDSLDEARAEGVTIVLVEQFVDRALALADQAVVLRRGRIAWRGPAGAARAAAAAQYMGDGHPPSVGA